MKARRPGVIVGTALEALPSGSGTLLVFVDREWIGETSGQRLADLERQVAELRLSLARTPPQEPAPRISSHGGGGGGGSGISRDGG